jgi:hypothetical protein
LKTIEEKFEDAVLLLEFNDRVEMANKIKSLKAKLEICKEALTRIEDLNDDTTAMQIARYALEEAFKQIGEM